MLYHLLYENFPDSAALNVFKYISFRALMAILCSLALSLVIGHWLIAKLTKKNIGQEIRSDGPQTHLSKKGTPTMGGLAIIGSVLITALLWARLSNIYVWLVLFAVVSFGWLGFVDDYRKFKKKNTKGVSARGKLAIQWTFAFLISGVLYYQGFNTELYLPFFKNSVLDLGWGFIPFAALVIVSASNAVNLTDGLDGLAIGPTMTCGLAFLFICYFTGHYGFARYLNIPYIPSSGELTIVLGSLIGAGLGFLWYNSYPAQVFMGDVGSLSLGAFLGTIAVVTKNEILFIFLGIIFVIETLSVILQVASFKLTQKRIFKMAPIHHHFELKGWAEPKVIVRFWIISVIAALLCLSTLKLR